MDFERVLGTVIEYLEGQRIPYALIGGLSMAAYGMARSTIDVDIVVPAECQEGLLEFLEGLGYEALHVSSGYSNHLHFDASLGRVDFVYVRGETSRELFESRRWVPGPAGRNVAVLRPELLAAMKIFAMKNDPSRAFRELADIQYLMTQPGVDLSEIEDQFEKHGLGERFEELKATLS